MREGRTIAVTLAGNPNVGKSTVFNALTGLKQHTGNWSGKTVTSARGEFTRGNVRYIVTDVPGTYSLAAQSPDEEAARDDICFGGGDVTVVVCDAACLERGLGLVFQTLEVTGRVVVCVNLMDEAEKRGVAVDTGKLEKLLGVPVVGASARAGEGLDRLVEKIEEASARDLSPLPVRYPPAVEDALGVLCPALGQSCIGRLPARFLALRLLEGDEGMLAAAERYLGAEVRRDETVQDALEQALWLLEDEGVHDVRAEIAAAVYARAAQTVNAAVTRAESGRDALQRRVDRLLTRRATGFPLMIALLAAVFYLTIRGANVPSALLEELFTWFGGVLRSLAEPLPPFLRGALLDGVYGTLSSVVAVMLPPMAVFFPLFTLLEDIGYLPRAAFTLDSLFRRAGACGKQALTM